MNTGNIKPPSFCSQLRAIFPALRTMVSVMGQLCRKSSTQVVPFSLQPARRWSGKFAAMKRVAWPQITGDPPFNLFRQWNRLNRKLRLTS